MNKICIRDFPGGPVVENLSTDAGGTDGFNSWPGQIPRTSEQLSPCPTTTEAHESQSLCSIVKEAITMRSLHPKTKRVAPTRHN